MAFNDNLTPITISKENMLVAFDESIGQAIKAAEEAAESDTYIYENRSKSIFDITGSHPEAQPYDCHTIDFSSVSYSPARIDVFLNGQLLRTGSAQDYVLHETGSISFNSRLEQDDMIQIVMF